MSPSSSCRPSRCWQSRILLGPDHPSDQDFKAALQAYYTASCVTEEACVRSSSWLAGTLERRGDYMGALEYYSRAARSGGDDARTWLAIARVARAARQPRRAAEALQRAGRFSGDPELRRDIDRARVSALAEDRPSAKAEERGAGDVAP